MSDQTTDPIQDNHDVMFQDGLKMIDDALAIFLNLDSIHGKAVASILHAALSFGETIYNTFKK